MDQNGGNKHARGSILHDVPMSRYKPPKESEKAANFIERNKSTRLNFKLFDAIDGAVLSDDEAIRSGIVARNANGYKRGTIGCAASHLALWKQCGSGERNFIIFEDDAFIRHDFKEQVEALISNRDDWDIVSFGFNTDFC